MTPNGASVREADPAIVAWTTVRDLATAEALAERLVGAHLSACVQIVPAVRSVYRWNGAVERADEVQLQIKSRASLFSAIEALFRAHHPYELPELVAIPVSAISRDYLAWLADETAAAGSGTP